MISKLDIAGQQTTLTPDLKRYIRRKIGKLDKYLPRHARISAHAEAKLKEFSIKAKKQCSFEVILHLPHETIACKETTINMFAAVDIVEQKLKNLIKTYKGKHNPPRLHRRVWAKIKRQINIQ